MDVSVNRNEDGADDEVEELDADERVDQEGLGVPETHDQAENGQAEVQEAEVEEHRFGDLKVRGVFLFVAKEEQVERVEQDIEQEEEDKLPFQFHIIIKLMLDFFPQFLVFRSQLSYLFLRALQQVLVVFPQVLDLVLQSLDLQALIRLVRLLLHFLSHHFSQPFQVF